MAFYRYYLKREKLGVNLSSHELMVVGDVENDIGMIKMAKIGIAMGNALPEINKYSDHATLDNENNLYDCNSLALPI